MRSRREIETIIIGQIDLITNALAEARRNGEANFTVNERDQEIANFLNERPDLRFVGVEARFWGKRWERLRIPSTTHKTEEGQIEFNFGYKPNGVIRYDQHLRGFMRDMGRLGVIKRLQWIRKRRSDVNNGIDVQEIYYLDRLEAFDETKYKNLDQLEREVFGWEPLDEEPPRDDEDEDDEN